MINKTIIGVLVVIVAALGIKELTQKPQTEVIVKKELGAATGPELSSPYFTYGSVRTWRFKTPLTAAASTTCSIQAPAATSTLSGASIVMTSIASTTVVELGYSTNSAYATTTVLARLGVVGGAQTLINATNTVANLTDGIVAPNSFVNVKIGGGSVRGTVDPAGFCTAEFREVQ